MAFQDEKEAVIAAIKSRKCKAANYVNENAKDYEGLLASLFEFAQTFDCDLDYLDELLSLINSSELLTLGVYFNQTVVGTVTNPRYIANSSIGTVVLNQSHVGPLEIALESQVANLQITGNANISTITVAGDAKVTLLTVTAGSKLNALLIKECQGKKGEVTQVTDGSNIEEIGVTGAAVFGGFTCEVATILT
jgi:hypothetical protein